MDQTPRKTVSASSMTESEALTRIDAIGSYHGKLLLIVDFPIEKNGDFP